MGKTKRAGVGTNTLHQPAIWMGTVQSVDPNTHTCTVVPMVGGMPIEGVPLNPMNMGKDGGGSFFMPQVNSPVWLCRPSDQATPFIMAGASLPQSRDSGDDEEDPNDHRMDRPVLPEGDQLFSGPGGQPYVALRNGGTLEIGSTQTCYRWYLPTQDLIREVFQNLEQNAAGGKLEWKTRTDDDTHGEDKDPVEFRIQVKEFSDESPMIDFGFGRIKDENERSIFRGAIGEVVGRLIITDVDGKQVYASWIDKKGNSHKVQAGSVFRQCSGRKVDYVNAGFFQQVRKVAQFDYGSRSAEIQGADELTVKGNRSVSIGGSVDEKVTGPTTRVTGRVEEQIKGSHEKSVEGAQTTTTTQSMENLVGGDYIESVGGTPRKSSPARRR